MFEAYDEELQTRIPLRICVELAQESGIYKPSVFVFLINF